MKINLKKMWLAEHGVHFVMEDGRLIVKNFGSIDDGPRRVVFYCDDIDMTYWTMREVFTWLGY